jgi:hypothetical protein
MTADLLARVWPHAEDLVRRVDAQIQLDGAPPEHPVWTQLRRVGALPTDAVEHFLWLDAGSVGADRDRVIDEAEAVRTTAGQVRSGAWRGAGAEAYAARWTHLIGYIDDLDRRMSDTALFLGEAARWVRHSRDELAMELAACLGSREAVAIKVELTSGGAAADLAERILAAVADCIESGWQLRQRWADRLGEVPWREPDGAAVVATDHLEVR